MNTAEKQPKTVEGMLDSMGESMKFIDSRLGFIGEQYPYADGKEVLAMLEEVKTFIESPKSKEYFHQWYDYATLFDQALNTLKFKAELADSTNEKDPANNTSLAEAKEILEDLHSRIENANKV